MENASKALIIAGAILISILLISVGLLVFNSIKGTTESGTEVGGILSNKAESALDSIKGEKETPAEYFDVNSGELSLSPIGKSAIANGELTQIVIPASIGAETISSSAFADCKKLVSIKLPDTITSLGSHTFENCTSLVSVELPANITYIYNDTFKNCTSLTSIVIPNSVGGIGSYAFSGCKKLRLVNIANSVQSIGIYAFQECELLQSVELPENISIGDYAFYKCTSLSDVIIPESVTEIGVCAFAGCYSLKQVTVSKDVGAISFSNSTEINHY